MKKLLIAISMLMVCGVSHAQFIFSPAFSYEHDTEEATTPAAAPDVTTDRKSSVLNADLRFGYILPSGIYVGGMYSLLTGTETAGSIDTDLDGYQFGPSVGYYDPTGFYSVFTIHLMGELGANTGGAERTFTGATGFQLDLGWNFPITSRFGIGPQVTYKNIEYAEVESTGNATVDTDLGASQIDWSLAVWFMF